MRQAFFYFFLLIFFSLDNAHGQIYTYKGLRIDFKGLATDSFEKDADLLFDIEVKSLNKESRFYKSLEYGPQNVYGNFYYEVLQFDTAKAVWLDITKDIQPLGLHNVGNEAHSYDLKFDLEKIRFRFAGESRAFKIRLDNYMSRLLPGQYLIKVYLRVDVVLGKNSKGEDVTANIIYLASKGNNFYIVDHLK